LDTHRAVTQLDRPPNWTLTGHPENEPGHPRIRATPPILDPEWTLDTHDAPILGHPWAKGRVRVRGQLSQHRLDAR